MCITAKIEMEDYLRDNLASETPAWLKQFRKGDPVDFREVLRSRSVYYPGSGDDGRAFKLFSSAHAAHVFLYVDPCWGAAKWREILEHTPMNGYRIIDDRSFSLRDMGLAPNGMESEGESYGKALKAVLQKNRRNLPDCSDADFCYFVVFEREDDKGFDDRHGVDRFAAMFVMEDAIPAYAALFGLPSIPAPTYLINQSDMVTSGLFGAGSPLEQVADAIGKHPEYSLVSLNAEPWKHYTKNDSVKPRGSVDCHGKNWYLYRYDA